MADNLSMALDDLLRKVELEGDVDILREGVRVFRVSAYLCEHSSSLGVTYL